MDWFIFTGNGKIFRRHHQDEASIQMYLTRVLTVSAFHYSVRHLPTTSGIYSFRLLRTSQEWLPGLELGAENSDPQMEKHSRHFLNEINSMEFVIITSKKAALLIGA